VDELQIAMGAITGVEGVIKQVCSLIQMMVLLTAGASP